MDITPAESSEITPGTTLHAVGQSGEPARVDAATTSTVQSRGGKSPEEFLGGLLEFIGEAQAHAETISAIVPLLEPADREALQSSLDRLNSAITKSSQALATSAVVPSTQSGVYDAKTRSSWRWQLRDSPLLLFSFLAAGLWLCVFAAGISIPASPYMAVLAGMHESNPPLGELVSSCALVLLCSTTTNPGILACLAAMLGGLSNLAHIDGRSVAGSEISAAPVIVDCFAPMLRGFFVYLALLAGLLLLTTQAITKASQDQYVQLAGTVSVLAFMVGYDPDVFRKIMGRVNGWAAKGDSADASRPK